MDKETLLHAIETLEYQRTLSGETAVDTTLAAMQSQLNKLDEDKFIIDQKGVRFRFFLSNKSISFTFRVHTKIQYGIISQACCYNV
jgi:hypothetical protein